MYLLPAGEAPRSKTKWRGLGAVTAARETSFLIRAFPRPVWPAPMPVAPNPMPPIRTLPIGVRVPIFPPPPAKQLCQPGDAQMANAHWDPVACRWVPDELPIITPPVTSSTTGTPVPAGFPVNQFFVAPDGSVWEYSAASKTWMNTGTPYNVGGGGGGTPTSSSGGSGSGSAPSQPVSVTVNAPAASSGGYQAVLDWLTQQTLISGIPNWVIAGGGVLLAYKMGSGGKR